MPVFLSRESCGQRSLAGYSPWGHKESDMTERLTLSLLCCQNMLGIGVIQKFHQDLWG